MKKILFFVLIAFIMNGCITMSLYKSIDKIEKDTVSFNSLPIEVKEFFYKSKKKSYEFYLTQLFTFNTAYEYELKTIYTVKGLWISHYLLIDKTNNITYRIDYGTPYPFIVFDKELFIPTGFNIFSMIMNKSEDEIEKMDLTFNRYLLEKFNRRAKKVHGNVNADAKSKK